MVILDTNITRVHRNRDFGRLEARVSFLAKTQKGQPPHTVSVLTNVPLRGDSPLRERLLESATSLVRTLNAAPAAQPAAA